MAATIIAVVAVFVAVLGLVLTASGFFYPKPLTDLKRDFDQFKDTYRDKHEDLSDRIARLEGKLNGR